MTNFLGCKRCHYSPSLAPPPAQWSPSVHGPPWPSNCSTNWSQRSFKNANWITQMRITISPTHCKFFSGSYDSQDIENMAHRMSRSLCFPSAFSFFHFFPTIHRDLGASEGHTLLSPGPLHTLCHVLGNIFCSPALASFLLLWQNP
jgi:hypothetical protein